MNNNIFISVFLSVLGGLLLLLGIVHLKNDERGSIRLDPPHRKPGWYAIIISPGFLYLAFLCGVIMLCVVALLYLSDPVLLSVQGGV